MHYSATAFASKNGLQTIKPLKKLDSGVIMGQRNKLSDGDIARLNIMYKC